MSRRVLENKKGKQLPQKSENWLRNKEDFDFYNRSTWRKFSLNYKRNNPVCEMGGCTQPSYYTDHIKPISEGGAKLNETNVQALCRRCNAIKTSKQSKKKITIRVEFLCL